VNSQDRRQYRLAERDRIRLDVPFRDLGEMRESREDVESVDKVGDVHLVREDLVAELTGQ
jgi:hypothetical protein